MFDVVFMADHPIIPPWNLLWMLREIRYIHISIHTYRQTDRHTYRQTEIHTYIQTYIQTDIHTDRHTYIQTYIHTYRQRHQLNPGSIYEASELVYLQAQAETEAWIQAELVYDVACLAWIQDLWSAGCGSRLGPNWGRLNQASVLLIELIQPGFLWIKRSIDCSTSVPHLWIQ